MSLGATAGSQRAAVSEASVEHGQKSQHGQIIPKAPYYSDLETIDDQLRRRMISAVLQLRSITGRVDEVEYSYVPILLDYVEWLVCVEDQNELLFTEEKTARYLLYLIYSNIGLSVSERDPTLIADFQTLNTILYAFKNMSPMLGGENYPDTDLYTKLQLIDNDLQLLRNGKFTHTGLVLNRAKRTLLTTQNQYDPSNPYGGGNTIDYDKEILVTSSPPPIDSSVEGDREDSAQSKELISAKFLTHCTQISNPSSNRVDVQATLSSATDSQQSRESQNSQNGSMILDDSSTSRIQKIADAIEDETIRKDFIKLAKNLQTNTTQYTFMEAYEKTKDAFQIIIENLDSFKKLQSNLPSAQLLLQLVGNSSLRAENSNEVSIRSLDNTVNKSKFDSQGPADLQDLSELEKIRQCFVEESNERKEATRLFSNYFEKRLKTYSQSADCMQTKLSSLSQTYFSIMLPLRDELNLLKGTVVSKETHDINMASIEETLKTVMNKLHSFSQEIQSHRGTVASLDEKTGQALQKIVSLKKRYGQYEDTLSVLTEEIRKEVLNEKTINSLMTYLESSDSFTTLRHDIVDVSGKYQNLASSMNRNVLASHNRSEKTETFIKNEMMTLDRSLSSVLTVIRERDSHNNAVINGLINLNTKTTQDLSDLKNQVTELESKGPNINNAELTKLAEELKARSAELNVISSRDEQTKNEFDNIAEVISIINNTVKTIISRFNGEFEQFKLSRTKDLEEQARFRTEIEHSVAQQENEFLEYKKKTEKSTKELHEQLNELRENFVAKVSYDNNYMTSTFGDVFSQIGEIRSTQQLIFDRLDKMETANFSKDMNRSRPKPRLIHPTQNCSLITEGQLKPREANGGSPAQTRPVVDYTPNKSSNQNVQGSTTVNTPAASRTPKQLTPQQQQLARIRKREKQEQLNQLAHSAEANSRISGLLNRKKNNDIDKHKKRKKTDAENADIAELFVVSDEEEEHGNNQDKAPHNAENRLQLLSTQGQVSGLKKIKLFRDFDGEVC